MKWLSIVLMGVYTLAGCAGAPVQPKPKVAVEAKRVPDPPKPVELVEIPELLPLPGQLKPILSESPPASEGADPIKRVKRANELARVEPARANFIDATQVWPFNPDALYQVYTSPGNITDISLETGEELTSVSAGDTVRWIIGDTTSGAGRLNVCTCLSNPREPTFAPISSSTPIAVPIIWNYPQPPKRGLPRCPGHILWIISRS